MRPPPFSSSEAVLFATNMLYSKLARSFTRRSSLSRHCLLYNGRGLAIFGEEATNSIDSSRLGFLRGYLTSCPVKLLRKRKFLKGLKESEENMKSLIQSGLWLALYFSSLTLKGVRRVLEKDLQLEEFAMDAHKRFAKKCFTECIEKAEDDNVSDNCGDTAEINGSSAIGEAAESPNGRESKNHVNERGSKDEEKMEESPVLGLLTGHKTSEIESKSTQSVHDEVVLDESMIKKAIRKKVSYIKTNLETFTNNVLSTAQQIWLRKLGGAKAVVSEHASGIITAGRAKRSDSQPVQPGERFRKLKEEERRKKLSKALSGDKVQALDSTSDSDEDSEEETNEMVNFKL